jgi:hypothetical protein
MRDLSSFKLSVFRAILGLVLLVLTLGLWIGLWVSRWPF